MTAEVYCPKCGQNFEEGSRRFCPTDGSRLISDSYDQPAAPGVFSNLIPKAAPVGGADEVLSETAKSFVREPELDLFGDKKEVLADDLPFFELDDIQPIVVEQPEFVPPPPLQIPDPVLEPKPAARKINPYEIPAGHVELGDSERTASVFNDFDANDPDGFVGRMVKGRYKVTEYLGGDETGLAYLADDKIVSDKMVLVRILLEGDADPMMESILAEERVSLSHFSHPNIARLVDSGAFTNGTEFLISEYTDALSVRDILSIHGKFHAARTARVIRQASYALSEAHQEGIIHRDIRPENIILSISDSDAEQIKLVNFGASNGDPNPHNAAYKAPEILDGRVSTAASDTYSLAVVAYEMLTGNVPFEGESTKELMRLQHGGLKDRPSQYDPNISEEVDEVFDKAFAFKAVGRYTKAREFGDALFDALTDAPQVLAPAAVAANEVVEVSPDAIIPDAGAVTVAPKVENLKPLDTTPVTKQVEPAWKNRSPEPPQEETSRGKILAVVGILALLALVVLGLYYFLGSSGPKPVDANLAQNTNGPSTPTITSDTEMPPQPRKIAQPANTEYYSNNKQNLKGDLLRNFVGFSLYYPKEWKLNGPQESITAGGRGKFLDISRSTPEGKLKEQMLVSYYPSKGTFNNDADKFPQMVKETNETLKKLLPGYQMVSEGEIKLNGDWRAYEVKFQGGGTSETGEKLVVWGRRLFIPASRLDARNGFEITMLATSLADEVKSVDDVGVHGELASILYSFEPTQNF